MSDSLIYEIKSDECVGDSVSKHNYNVLSLDTTICNLSSIFFNTENNYYTQFSDLSSNIDKFNLFADTFEDPTRFNEATSTTRILSSYWNQYIITLTFPLNIYEIGTFKKIKSYIDGNTTQQTLIEYGLNILNSKYPPANFRKNSKANIIFLLYSNTGQASTTKTQTFTITNRTFNITNRKDDVNIAASKIVPYFINNTQQWEAVPSLIL